MNPRLLLSVVAASAAIAATPLRGDAQLGWALGIRNTSGETANDANGDRKGYEARLMYDRDLTPLFGLRGEVAYNQMQYQRTDGGLRFQVAENGFEAIVAARTEFRRGALTGAFLSAGPVASFRAACGSSSLYDSNGRVACDEGETFLAGYMLGGGYRWMAGRASDVTLEVRYLGNVTSAQGQDLIALSVGLRRRTGSGRR